MPDPEVNVDENPNIKNIRGSDFRSVYCNQTAFSSTAFDFSMIFGEITEVNQEEKQLTVEQRVRVVMSPLHFKIFTYTCLQNIKNYESAFGKIRAPEGTTAAGVESLAEETPVANRGKSA